MPGPGAAWFGDEERREVLDVLVGGHLSRYGDLADADFKHKVYDLEREFAAYCGTSYAIATNSGTASLLLALQAAGVGDGDEVIVPGFTYVATYAAIIYARAIPVLAEINESLTIDPGDVQRKITGRTRAIIAVHMLGNPCAMDELTRLTEAKGISLIEDCCQASGASYRGRKVGSIGLLGAFSLNRYKVISAGEGGLVTTNDQQIYERVFALHDQGHQPLRAGKVQPPRSVIGGNAKMNELTGAVALAQLRKLDRIVATLRDKKQLLRQQIPEVPGVWFRRLNDPEGECATFLTLIFDDPTHAATVAACLGSTTLDESGWHNYRRMEHVSRHDTPLPHWSEPGRYVQPGDLPTTDSLLARSVNISVGVVDRGLAAGFGITIDSSMDEIARVGGLVVEAIRSTRRG